MEITIIPAKDKIDQSGTCPLLIYVFLGSIRFKISSKIRATIGKGRGQFHPEKKRIVEKVTGLSVHEEQDRLNRLLNERLDEMKAFLERTLRQQQIEKQLDIKLIKAQFDERFFGKAIKKNKTLTDWIKSYVDSKKGIYSDEYIRGHKSVVAKILQYNNPDIEAVNNNWFSGYRQFLAEAQVSDKAHCTFIRNAVQQAEMAGEKVKKDYLDFIYCKNENVIKVFHSLAEVTGLIGYYNCLQPGHRKNALSMYLFAIHTGLRWSDVCGLKWVNISVNEIDFSSQKGKRNNTLYMPAMAIDILSQQDNGSEYCFPKRSRQRTSYLIKKICEDLKFNDQIEKVWFRGNTRHSKVYKKWELVSFHTARHTYAVLSIKLGVDLVTLQDNMGHSDPKTTRIYAKLTEKDRTQRTANAWDKLSLGEHKAE